MDTDKDCSDSSDTAQAIRWPAPSEEGLAQSAAGGDVQFKMEIEGFIFW
jgi:hypothetical protein